MIIRCRDFVFKEQMTPRKHKIAIDTSTVSRAVLHDISSGSAIKRISYGAYVYLPSTRSEFILTQASSI